MEKKEVLWHWEEQHDAAIRKIMQLICESPVLKYFDPHEEIVIQCDASQNGLGAVLLQSERPICYASRALTDCEQRYAQIEKEALAIAFACLKFRDYVYG